MTGRARKLLFIAPLAIVGLALFIVVGGAIVQWLWNWLLPPLFGWPQLTFWQALALLALCRILFGGFGAHGGPRGRIGGRGVDRIADRIGDRLTDKWQGLTPEERERFRQRMRERFGVDAPGAGGTPAE